MKRKSIFNGMGFAGQTGKLGDVLEKLEGGKVDKEDGKTLSSNDFTDEYKQKIDELYSAAHPEESQENANDSGD